MHSEKCAKKIELANYLFPPEQGYFPAELEMMYFVFVCVLKCIIICAGTTLSTRSNLLKTSSKGLNQGKLFLAIWIVFLIFVTSSPNLHNRFTYFQCDRERY